eukprot:1280924-Pleurochrysis_carterae.AAC.1
MAAHAVEAGKSAQALASGCRSALQHLASPVASSHGRTWAWARVRVRARMSQGCTPILGRF